MAKLTISQALRNENRETMAFTHRLDTEVELKEYKEFRDKPLAYLIKQHKKLPKNTCRRNMTLRSLTNQIDYVMFCNVMD